MTIDTHVKDIRTAWVRDWTRTFLVDLSKQETAVQIETYCKNKLEEFSKVCETNSIESAKQQGKEVDPTAWKKSAVSNLSDVRKALNKWVVTQKSTEENSYEFRRKDDNTVTRSHKALLYMNYGRDFLNETKAKGDAKKQAQRRNLTPITNITAYQSAIELACMSNEWRDLAVGIQAALGTRLGETLLTAEIKQLSQFQGEHPNFAKRGEESKTIREDSSRIRGGCTSPLEFERINNVQEADQV